MNYLIKRTFSVLALVQSFSCLIAQIVNPLPLSPRLTGYSIDARLDVNSKTITGEMDAFWVNSTNETVPDVQLHLYMNAFRNTHSTYMKEQGGSPGNDTSAYGWTEIKCVTGRNGTNLAGSMNFISPDDRNAEDKTVVRILLPSAAAPGDTVFLKIRFETKMPSRIRRTGYNKDYYFVAQWFPKFGVYEPAGMRYRTTGGWNCHQFHANSEFYANHSVYDVRITLPKEYITGSGGMLIKETMNPDNTKTLTFRAEDIVDFAWTAWPGYAVFTDHWKHVKITLLMPKERSEQVGRQFTAVKNALEYLTDNVGPYPWPHLTFVDPPAIGSGAGGMEYTTIFTSTSSYKMPPSIHMPEMVTVHEFGHAYFMGILASNEFEEPWMDEGINSFWEERIMDHYWGEKTGMMDHLWLSMADKTMSRTTYVLSPSRQAVSNNEFSWNYPHGTYSMMSYMKTATWLWTLMGIIGEDTMNDIFREYYKRWAFRHPSGKDFIAVVNEVVKAKYGEKFGPDMNWFFDETLYGTGICDYKVVDFSNYMPEKLTGRGEIAGNEADSLRISTADSVYSSVVEVERAGEVIIPVDVLVHFSNGDEILEHWDGKARFRDFRYEGKRNIEWVKIDPEFRNRMDMNFINNSMTATPDRVPVRRFADKLILGLEMLLNIFML